MAGTPALAQLPGVIDLRTVWNGQSNARTPLLAVSPRWSSAPNAHGVPGAVMSLTTQAALRSSHGSASPFDLHALLIANGASFQRGSHSLIPTGAIDLLPTILHLIDLPQPEAIDGRPLWEIMRQPQGEPGAVEHRIIEPLTPSRNATQSAQLALHQVGQTTYLHGARQSDAAFITPTPP